MSFSTFLSVMKTPHSDSISDLSILPTCFTNKEYSFLEWLSMFLKYNYFLQVILILCISLHSSMCIFAVAISVPCSVLSHAVCYVKVICLLSLSAARMLYGFLLSTLLSPSLCVSTVLVFAIFSLVATA